jgi:hypothetical protein
LQISDVYINEENGKRDIPFLSFLSLIISLIFFVFSLLCIKQFRHTLPKTCS